MFVMIVMIMMMILLVMIMMIICYVIISFCFYHAFWINSNSYLTGLHTDVV